MGLTSKNTLDAIYRIFDYAFKANSICDNIVYYLDIKQNQPSFQKFFHENVAHIFPMFADKIQSFGSLRNDIFHRGEVTKSDKQYNSTSEAVEDFVLAMVELETLTINAIKIAIQNEDFAYEDFLRDFNFSILPIYTKQALVFYDAIKTYEQTDDIHKWNSDYESFIIENFVEGG